MINSPIYDCVIVGGGPAGLTAAVYLGRYRRHCLVLHDEQSRARWIPASHNIPCFLAGVGGADFLHTLSAQATGFGAACKSGRVHDVRREGGLSVLNTEDGSRYRARYVLLATGVRDHLPDLEGAAEGISRGVLRICPICDAFEAIDKRIAILANGPLGAKEAKFLRHYTGHPP